jgi:hypothetical protein
MASAVDTEILAPHTEISSAGDLTVDIRTEEHVDDIVIVDSERTATVDPTGLTRVAMIDLSSLGATLELNASTRSERPIVLALGRRTAHVIDAHHPLVPQLVVLEAEAVAVRGDRVEFDAWLADTEGAVFVVLTSSPDLTIETVVSLSRLTMHPRCDRGLRELARLLGRNPEDVINDFRERTSFDDLRSLVDLRTLAVPPAAAPSARAYAEELGALIDAVATVLLVMAGRGDAGVVTVSLDEMEKRWLDDAGWPLGECLDAALADVLRGTRSRAGRSIPGWFRLHGLWGAVAAQRTVSLSNAAFHLHHNHIDLGTCIPRTRSGRSAL